MYRSFTSQILASVSFTTGILIKIGQGICMNLNRVPNKPAHVHFSNKCRGWGMIQPTACLYIQLKCDKLRLKKKATNNPSDHNMCERGCSSRDKHNSLTMQLKSSPFIPLYHLSINFISCLSVTHPPTIYIHQLVLDRNSEHNTGL